jgi:hypothetical protein
VSSGFPFQPRFARKNGWLRKFYSMARFPLGILNFSSHLRSAKICR